MSSILLARGPFDSGDSGIVEAIAAEQGTLADLLRRLGGIAPSRVLLDPPPGTATERDLFHAQLKHRGVYELVEGTLVEKGMGIYEGILAAFLIGLLDPFVRKHNLGIVTPPDTMLRLFKGVVRAPDVGFVSWDRFPDRRLPKAKVPAVAPDLAIEVLSESNTKAEMARKRREYFASGSLLVWEVDPKKRVVKVYTSPTASTLLKPGDTLTAPKLLPRFKLPVAKLFGALDRHG